ncbi:MAG: NfeD family protein [Bacteroidales bacterium]|jgi:membrane-bound ClpP family serine protease|nr:NfeD family protein [Bacteroidales bacterium]
MDIVFIAILVVLGFALLLLELLVLPGVGVAAIGGFLLLGVSIWQIFSHYGVTAGVWSIVVIAILSLVFIYFALRAKTWRRAALKSEIDGKADGQPDVPICVGDQGKTVSRLAPAGKAYINGDYFEVRTFGEMLDPEAEIEVIKIENRTIYVKSIKTN